MTSHSVFFMICHISRTFCNVTLHTFFTIYKHC